MALLFGACGGGTTGAPEGATPAGPEPAAVAEPDPAEGTTVEEHEEARAAAESLFTRFVEAASRGDRETLAAVCTPGALAEILATYGDQLEAFGRRLAALDTEWSFDPDRRGYSVHMVSPHLDPAAYMDDSETFDLAMTDDGWRITSMLLGD